MKKNKKLLQLKKDLQNAIGTIWQIKAEAINNNARLVRDCDLLYSSSLTLLHYVVNIIDEYKNEQ